MRKMTRFAIVVMLLLSGISTAQALPNYLDSFKATYPNVVGTRLDSCTTCHNPDFTRNAYGLDFAANGHSFGAIAGKDSDGDSFANSAEILALTFPGNGSDHPVVAPPPPPPPPGPISGNDMGMPAPTAQQRFPYAPPVYPFVGSDPAVARPIGVGPVAEGGGYLSIQVGLGTFQSPTDLYFVSSIPSDPERLYFMNADYSVTAFTLDEVAAAMALGRFPPGVEPWKSSISGPVNEIILNTIPTSELEAGSYVYYLFAAPTGSLENYYLWGTAVDVELPAGEGEDDGGGGVPEELLISEPDGQIRIPHDPVGYPVISNDSFAAKPLSVGPVAAGGPFVSVQVGLGKFVGPMDLYVAYALPAVPDKLYFMKADYSVTAYSLPEIVQFLSGGSLSAAIEPWKKSSTGVINEIILNNVSIADMNNGAYGYYLLAAPSGTMDRYYIWGSEFHIENGTGTAADPLGPPVLQTDGTALYRQNCAVCHGRLAVSAKPGRSPEQIQAAINTVGHMQGLGRLQNQQVNAIAAVLAVPLPPPATLDGATLYRDLCAGCHNALASSTKAGATAARITGAIGKTTNPAMNTAGLKALSAAQINALAGVLAKATPPPPPATLDGATLYRDLCAGCHNGLASSTKAGATAARITGAIGKTTNPAMNTAGLKALSPAQINAIAGVLAAVAPPPTVSHHPSNWRSIHGDQVEHSGVSTCQSCHGTDLRGGAGPSCYTCHGRQW